MFEDAMQTPPQHILDEALVPDLSKDFFQYTYDDEDGQNVSIKVKLKPLYVVNQKKFSRTIALFIDNVAYDLENSQWVSSIANAARGAEALPELVCILLENDSPPEFVTDRMRNYCTLQPLDMVKILRRFAEKNAEVCAPILGFFDSVWPIIKQNALAATLNLKEKTLAALEKTGVEIKKEAALPT